jgi:hypothetical protein
MVGAGECIVDAKAPDIDVGLGPEATPRREAMMGRAQLPAARRILIG